MSKRNSDGDIIFNKLSLTLAKHQRLLESFSGPKTEADIRRDKLQEDQENDDLKDQSAAAVQAGIGARTLKEIEDGTFARRAQTSNDRLLEQLLGPKAARAHKAAKQAPKETAKPQKSQKFAATSKLIESEDEEEGRAAAFKSKKRKSSRGTKSEPRSDTDALENRNVAVGFPHHPIEAADSSPDEIGRAAEELHLVRSDSESHGETPTRKASLEKSKPKSFLDEILSERSKKKKKKKRSNAEAVA